MCGIIGYKGGFEPEDLFAGLKRIAHRGPDGEGVFFDADCALGHRRLSIIDLSDKARQPFDVLDRYVITYNGEIYNYRELREELRGDGFVFRSESDTEVLLFAYVKWGGHFVKRLNGMWALCIYDKQNGTLFFSRDRMGKKPLFYTQMSRGLVFCSEMKGIYPFLDQVRINQPVAQRAMSNSFGYEHTPDCLIQGITRFPAAHNGYYVNGQLRLERYWQPGDCSLDVPGNYEEQKQMFRELFLDACRLRMRSDVTIGTALSGGLDSSAVICSMAYAQKHGQGSAVQKDWQHAFIAAFPGTSLDESAYARAVTDHLDIPAHFIDIDPLKDLDQVFHQTYLFEELFYAPVIPFTQLYGKIKAGGVTVSIDGHGADELFAGYPFDMDAALIDSLPRLSNFRPVLEAINNAYGKPANADYINKLKYALQNRYPLLQKVSRTTNPVAKRPGSDFLTSTLYRSSFENILPTLLRNYDRYSMMNGVEIRMPFLDYRIVEFAFAIPWSAKVRNGFGKAIVRESLADLMPAKVAFRKDKIGFNAPMHNWLGGELKEWANDLIHSTSFNNSVLIDRETVRASVTRVLNQPNGSFAAASKAFEMLTPVIWEKSLDYAN